MREPHEFEICNLDGKLIPLKSLPERLGELDPKAAHRRALPLRRTQREGRRSCCAASGFENAWNVQGGILAWIDRIDPSLTRY